MRLPSSKRFPDGLIGAWGAIAALHLLFSLSYSVGSVNDEAMYILGAQSLRQGTFSVPDSPGGGALTDALPGLSILLVPLVWAIEPHWGFLRLLILLCAVAVIWGTQRAANKVLPVEQAWSIPFLVALNPVLIRFAGVILPDIPYLALSLGLFEILSLPTIASWQFILLLLGAAWGGILRPYGVILTLSLAVGLGLRREGKRAICLVLAGGVPAALWVVRNTLILQNHGDYFFAGLRESARSLSDPWAQLLHFMTLLAFLSRHIFSLPHILQGLNFYLAVSFAGLCIYGICRILRLKPEPWIFSMAAYMILVAALHAVWESIVDRYLLTLLPMAWIFLIGGLSSFLKSRPKTALFSFTLYSVLSLAQLLAAMLAIRSHSSTLCPATLDWARHQLPHSSRTLTLRPDTWMLLARRMAKPMPAEVPFRDLWFEWILKEGFDHVEIASSVITRRYPGPRTGKTMAKLEYWLKSSRYAEEVYANKDEGTSIFRVRHPDPSRFHQAMELYRRALRSQSMGEDPGTIHDLLRRAVKLEPELTSAWAALAGPEKRRGS